MPVFRFACKEKLKIGDLKLVVELVQKAGSGVFARTPYDVYGPGEDARTGDGTYIKSPGY
ncbi:MAG TPA: hypothetical protein VKA08_16385 [Balneolales bacterium]|nr:hypothetical protein [Balneolales bacterium]